MKNRYFKIWILLMVVGAINLFSCKKKDSASLPTLTTLSVTDITASSAKSGGNINNDGNNPINSRGIVWGKNQSPTLEANEGLSIEGDGLGTFQGDLTGLLSNTNYYVRAFATNNAGTNYGNEQSFKTLGGQGTSNYRIISEDVLQDGQLIYTVNYVYTGVQISKLIYNWYNDGGGAAEINLQYPDNNTIIINYPWAEFPFFKISFSNNKPIEIIAANERKCTMGYNLDGLIETVKWSFYPDWTFNGEEETYTYNSGKLTQFTSYPDPAESKYVYSYNGDLINEVVLSTRESGGSWIVYSTAVYTYSGYKIATITRSDGLNNEYSYDSYGNLTEDNEYYQNYHTQRKYIYEQGSGNYRKITEYIDLIGPDFDFKEYKQPQPN
jgi:hypothetical protein